jgi:histidinol-phosphate phosphatase family protein
MLTDNKKLPVSVVVIAKNEEKRLADCLRSVSWASELVVIDDESSDRTAELAQSFGAKVYRRKMDIEGRQRNFGYDQASGPWVLSLDADERVTPELAEAIGQAISRYESDAEVVAFSLPIRTYIGSRWIKGAGYYPAPKTRLFRKGKFRYEEAGVHPRAIYHGRAVILKGDVLHYSCANLGEFMTKFNRETTLEAEKWVQDGRKISLPKALRKTADRFLKNYFLKKGWQDGLMGFVMSLFHGLYQLITYAKYREKKGMQRVVFIDRDGVVNEDPFEYVTRWEDFRFHEGVLPGLKKLTEAGYRIILISNQAGVGDGVYPENALWEIHRKMTETFKRERIRLHAAYYCLHGKQAGCDCRKPKTGLFEKAAQNGLLFERSRTYFVGDKSADIEAGKKFGLRTILVRTGYGRKHEGLCQGPLQPDAIVENFSEAVDRILCG